MERQQPIFLEDLLSGESLEGMEFCILRNFLHHTTPKYIVPQKSENAAMVKMLQLPDIANFKYTLGAINWLRRDTVTS